MPTSRPAHRFPRATVAFLLAAAATPTPAATRNWAGSPGGNWKLGPWSPAGTPGAGDNVSVVVFPTATYNITFNADYGPGIGALASIDLSSANALPLVLTQSAAGTNLYAANETIGLEGPTTFAQSASTHSLSGTLLFAKTPGVTGAYSLSGGLLAASDEILGSSGTGSFTQSGGSHQVTSTLTLGSQSGATGAYALSAGSLSAATMQLGLDGVASFLHTGGSVSATTSLQLAVHNAATSSYSLAGTTASLSASSLTVAVAGRATFAHSDGSVTVSSRLSLADTLGSSATYSLSGGALSANTTPGQFTYLGYHGAATVDHSGGTFAADQLHLGEFANSTGTYSLSAAGSLTANVVHLGESGAATFLQSGGIFAASNLYLAFQSGSSASYTLSGGTLSTDFTALGLTGTTSSFIQTGGTHTVSSFLQVDGPSAAARSTYSLSGGVILSARTNLGNGSFVQTGGTHAATICVLAFNNSKDASYSLSGTGLLSADELHVGSGGACTFLQTGGTVSASTFSVSSNSANAGSYTLADGILSTTDSTVGMGRPGTFTQTGGTHTVSNSLIVGAVNLIANPTTSSYSLNGAAASLAAGSLLVASGSLVISAGSATAGPVQIYDAPVASLGLAGGTLALSSLNTSGHTERFHWTGGTLSFTGGYAVDPSFVLGAAPMLPPGTTLASPAPSVNNGSITLPASSRLAGPGTLTNNSTITLAGPGATVSAPLVNAPSGFLAGAGTLSGPVANAGLLLPQSGTLTLAGPLTNTGTILVPATATLAVTLATTNPGSITLAGGTLDSSTAPFTNAGILTGRGTLLTPTLANTGSLLLSPASTLTLSGTLLTPTGSVDLTTGTLALLLPGPADAYPGLPSLRNALLTKHILSTTPDPTRSYSVGYAPNAGATHLLLKRTLTGDANLDGVLSADDFAAIDHGLATHAPNWWHGDFDYDGQVTPADYLLLDATFAKQQGGELSPDFLAQRESRFGPTYVAQLLTSIPEPSSLLVLYPLVHPRRRTHPHLASRARISSPHNQLVFHRRSP